MDNRSNVHSYEVEWDLLDEPLGIHVIDTEEATVLFGAGTENTAERITEIAADHDVDVVLVEHGDVDHYGGVSALREAFEDIEVAVPAGDASFLEEEGIEVDRLMKAGETYWGVTTILTPGHTPDNMSYLHDSVLIGGDTVVGSDSLIAAEGEWTGAFAVCISDYNADDAQTRESIPVLLDHDFDAVLISHGNNVTHGAYDEIEMLVADLE